MPSDGRDGSNWSARTSNKLVMLLTLSGHRSAARECPLLGVKRTFRSQVRFARALLVAILGLALSAACLSLFDGLIQRYLVLIIAVATLSTFAFQIAGIYELQHETVAREHQCS